MREALEMTSYALPVKPSTAKTTYNAKTSDTVSTPLTVERFVGKGRVRSTLRLSLKPSEL